MIVREKFCNMRIKYNDFLFLSEGARKYHCCKREKNDFIMACFSNLEFEVNSFCDMKSNTDHLIKIVDN